MSTIDLLTRVNTVIKKYEKYDPQKEKGATDIPNHDHWLKLYTSLQDDLNDALKVFFCTQTWTRMLQKCSCNPTVHIARYSRTLLLPITGHAACRTRNLRLQSVFGPSKMGWDVNNDHHTIQSYYNSVGTSVKRSMNTCV